MPPPYRVLVVEDDNINFELVCKILRKLPLDLVNAPTGAEAVAHLTREVPDLIILDIELPDMFGWEVLERFRNDGRLGQTHIIVLTAHKEPIHRLIGSLQAVSVYLHKPVKADELRSQVQQLLKLDA